MQDGLLCTNDVVVVGKTFLAGFDLFCLLALFALSAGKRIELSFRILSVIGPNATTFAANKAYRRCVGMRSVGVSEYTASFN